MRTLPRPSRRALLAGVGAVALTAPLAACDLPGGGAGDRTGDERTDGAAEPDPDLALVEAAATRTDEVLALLAATTAAHPRLDARLAPLAASHRAHLDALGRTGTDTDSGTPSGTEPETETGTADPPRAVPPNPARALRQVVARETAHAGQLTTAAQGAESGALARLLATMGAGVHMHLAALEDGAPA